jgi:hypothetical protein
MVTIELAMVSVLVAGVVGLVGWFGLQLVAYDLCQITAHEVARQSARGDAAAVARASSDVPAGAVVSVSDASEATTVVVRFTPVLLGVPLPPLDARATVLDEAKP